MAGLSSLCRWGVRYGQISQLLAEPHVVLSPGWSCLSRCRMAGLTLSAAGRVLYIQKTHLSSDASRRLALRLKVVVLLSRGQLELS